MYKIFFTALVAGSLAGIFVFAVQSVKLTPLILEAEVYENADAARNMIQLHEQEAWEPADGFERNAWRFVADLGVGIGFALMLVGAFSLRDDPMDTRRGVLWGLAGFAVFSLAPGFGLPPELPATMAADLSARQVWWVSAASATAFGLYAIVFGRSNALKAIGLAVMALPHIIGAPKPPLGGVVPTELNAEFAASSLATMAMFWVVLGALSGWLYERQSSHATA
ncbi:MAG: CbtA family protein [Pseudomonadota bacterium]|nr:CbtA family protein [Pseudomonadota bacterium]MDE3037999.1 CbtA family protein [Pseudomonadota bacterium]